MYNLIKLQKHDAFYQSREGGKCSIKCFNADLQESKVKWAYFRFQQDEKFSGKMEYSIFKYNLFEYYLENFALWNPLHKMQEQFSQKVVLYGIYRDFAK